MKTAILILGLGLILTACGSDENQSTTVACSSYCQVAVDKFQTCYGFDFDGETKDQYASICMKRSISCGRTADQCSDLKGVTIRQTCDQIEVTVIGGLTNPSFGDACG